MRTTAVPISELFATKRWCYTIIETETCEGQYIPCVVFEGEKGFYPMRGDPAKLQTPWMWGTNYTEADKIAQSMNEKRGITREIADKIVSSSF